ncbi:hypothetical protein [Neptuniibacter sp. CAU 1671]|uniref:ATP-grasp domain-containing protein n=1 Tax=Neptuniibacter sp. CAU 1671 TaxID=3032593 RepID=UPI0023DAFA31|nr:hypothetical protein [Neptuniibacter sp. CAU 1671]MDF2182039.1 hypothetical protein [Neptuniibacter sp. CAU 1671]
MKLVSFDPLRTLHFPPHTVLKPESMLLHQQTIATADWVLYPPYWLINSLVFGLKARIFPSLPSYLLGHNKIEMTRAFELVAPTHTPFTLIKSNTPENAEIVWDQMTLPFVAKLVKSSMGEGVFLIEDRSQWREYCAKADVLYAQEYLPIDRDLRIVVLGEEIVRGYWRMQSPYSFHNNIARGGEVLEGIIPPAAETLVKHLCSTLGINHAGFDIAMVGDHPYVIEFNRLFGNQGLSRGGINTADWILPYLQKELASHNPLSPKPRSPSGRRKKKSNAA